MTLCLKIKGNQVDNKMGGFRLSFLLLSSIFILSPNYNWRYDIN
jgi:hypothetical protein